MTVRPKTSSVLIFMCPDGAGCSMGVHPQQKWEAKPDGDKVRLTYKYITIKINKPDFDETFKVVEE